MARLPAVLLAIVALAGAIATFGIAFVRDALELQAYGASVPNPYFIAGHAALLYLAVPIITLALAFFLLSPGLLLAAATGRTKGPAQWLLTGFAWSLMLVIPATMLVQSVTGVVLRGPQFLYLVAALVMAIAPLVVRRAAAEQGLALDFAGKGADLAFALMVPFAALLAFSAKFYWEDFTPDGSGALQFSRLYVATLWPFWPRSAGIVAQCPDLSSMLFVFPASWFLRVIGEYEYAVRAPLLLALGLLHPVLIALIRYGRRERVTIADHLLISAIVLLFALANVYSGGYHPWFNDSPMPAMRETFALVVFLGFVLFLIEGRTAWTAVFAFLCYFATPTGLIWIALIPGAIWLVWRGRHAPRPAIAPALIALGAVLVFMVVAPHLIKLAGLPNPGYEFDFHESIHRMRFVTLDWSRFAYALIPGGIVPVAALFAWRRQDGLSRVFTVTAVVIFAFYGVQAYRILLHHFVPVMLLPAIVYWRTLVLPAKRPEIARLAVLAGVAVSAWLAWPLDFGLHTADRELGARIVTRGPIFETTPPVPGERFHGFNPVAYDVTHVLLEDAFLPDYAPDGPSHVFFGGPHVWYFYAQLPKQPGAAINYDLRPLATPGTGTLIAQHLGYGLFVANMDEYRRDRTRRLPYMTGAPLLAADRDVIFGSGASDGKRKVIDLVAVVRHVL